MAIKIENLESLTKLTDEEASNINGGISTTPVPGPIIIIIDPLYPEPESGGWILTGDASIYQQR